MRINSTEKVKYIKDRSNELKSIREDLIKADDMNSNLFYQHKKHLDELIDMVLLFFINNITF